MNLELVNKIANAVLYEGYLLYPYRASAVKNRQRWNFGGIYPEAFSIASGGNDASVMQTQCLLLGRGRFAIDVTVKFLHWLARDVADFQDGGSKDEDSGVRDSRSSILDPRFRVVESFEVEGRIFQSWLEAVEREVVANSIDLIELCTRPALIKFSFPATRETELVWDTNRKVRGEIIRRQQSIDGVLDISAERASEQLFKVTARISNVTAIAGELLADRDEALIRSFVSTHTIVASRTGEFVSLLDPPENLQAAAAGCSNIGTYPVLVGEEGERDLVLSSPIILYDYPQVAPESAGDLFDSTEIDEILTLRIMTLTEEEKREMRGLDERARQILERTETMPVEQLMKLHGAVRGLRPIGKDAE